MTTRGRGKSWGVGWLAASSKMMATSVEAGQESVALIRGSSCHAPAPAHLLLLLGLQRRGLQVPLLLLGLLQRLHGATLLATA